MENVLSTITIMPKDAYEREAFVERAVEELENGTYNIRTIHPLITSLEKLIKALKSEEAYRDLLERETDIIKVVEVRKYDFASSDDSTWSILNNRLKETKDALKSREQFLKALPPNGTIDSETGEVVKAPNFHVEKRLMPVK